MGEAVTATLKSLPVQTNPGYAVRLSLDRLLVSIARTEKALAPSVWKKLLGGTSKDHARGIVAACMEEARAVRGVISQARHAATSSSDGRGGALLGSIDRIIQALDQWRDSALEFEEAVFGADQKLLLRTRKLQMLCKDLKNPACGL